MSEEELIPNMKDLNSKASLEEYTHVMNQLVSFQAENLLEKKEIGREKTLSRLKIMFGGSKTKKFFDSADYYKEVWNNMQIYCPQTEELQPDLNSSVIIPKPT